MSYTWEAWALEPSALLAELAAPTLDPADVRFDPLDSALSSAHRQFAASARAVASSLAAGGGDLSGDIANYVVLVVRSLGSFAGSAGHTSSGGVEFRSELMGTRASAVLGDDTVVHLLVRDLGGLTVIDGPILGWVDAEECRRAADRVAAFEPDDDTDEDLWSILDAVVVGAARRTGLVTLYV